MDEKEYFRNIVALFEASNDMAIDNKPEGLPTEAEIADSGSDVNPDQMANVEENGAEGEIPQEYSVPAEPLGNDADQTISTEKSKKLFNLFEDLESYAKVFIENLNTIDIGLLEERTYEKFKEYLKKVETLDEKIKNYLTNLYLVNEYEKNLYAYILFRTELLATIKELRHILKLNAKN